MTLLRWLPRFRNAYRELPVLEARENWSRSAIESHQLERINVLWKQSCAHVRHYRDSKKSRKLPDRFASLDEFCRFVPLTSKEMVRSKPEAFLSDERGPGKWLPTSGSTGMVTRIYWSKEAHLGMLRYKYRFCASWGIDIFDSVLFLWGATPPLHNSLWNVLRTLGRRLEDWLRNRKRFSAKVYTPESMTQFLREAKHFEPKWMYAYSSLAHLLANVARRTGLDCPSLRTICLSAEPATEAMIRDISNAFGTKVIMEYGSIDCGYLAGEAPDGRLRVREDRVFLETIPLGNDRYEIVVTVLDNPDFPLVRFRLGDLTDRPLERPDRGFGVLSSVIGRTQDLVVTRTGGLLHPFRFHDIVESMPSARCWRVHQQADGSVSVDLETADSPSASEVSALKGTLEEELGGFGVEVRCVDRIPRTEAGKHRWIISDYLPENSQQRSSSSR